MSVDLNLYFKTNSAYETVPDWIPREWERLPLYCFSKGKVHCELFDTDDESDQYAEAFNLNKPNIGMCFNFRGDSYESYKILFDIISEVFENTSDDILLVNDYSEVFLMRKNSNVILNSNCFREFKDVAHQMHIDNEQKIEWPGF